MILILEGGGPNCRGSPHIEEGEKAKNPGHRGKERLRKKLSVVEWGGPGPVKGEL